jgi:hypothetical protein
MTLNGVFVRRVLLVAGIFLPLTATLAGCGSDDGLGKRFPVSGKVTYNGSPLAKGRISFVPEDSKEPGVGATGTIENGEYTLMTGGDNDGARAGKYKVTITAKEDAMEKAKALFAKANKGNDPGYLPGRFSAMAEADAKSLIPTGYGDTRTTNLTAEVKDGSNKIDFELSDDKAPPPAPDSAKASKSGGR